MTYNETLKYMFNSLPMYHRIGKAAYKADLANTVALMEYLGHPEKGFRSIHVAGTNGKGSVCHMTAAVLHRAGYKVGLYTSPHLLDFRERIRIDGTMIPEDEVVRFVESHKDFLDSLQLSFFEMTVGLAFDYFAREKVDVAVVEVGMGGRLDSTNVITPLVSVITNIGLDHTQFLGDTMPKIAAEKAGIIKKGVPVVVGETHPETAPVFAARAAEMEAPLYFADQNAALLPLSTMLTECCQLKGAYQRYNVRTLTQLLALLPSVGFNVGEQEVCDGVANVVGDTGLHGRWEVWGQHPTTICETAHNPAGMAAMVEKLSSLRYRRLHIVFGCVGDKDYEAVLSLLPRDADYYYTQPSVPRALPLAQLADSAQKLHRPGVVFVTLEEALAAARREATDDDLVLVTGSIFLVADAFALKNKQR